MAEAISDDDIALDFALALSLQRCFEAQEAQETTDEAIAYSLTLEPDHHFDNLTDVVEVSMADGKPPPHCSCCLMELPHATQRRVVPCGHIYCVKCIATRCKMGVRDRSLVPAHCCRKEFPTEYVKEGLNANDYATYERFVDERAWTHAGSEYQLVSDTEYAGAVAHHGWKQCPGCGVGVEKISGCDAIRCIRGHWFCFACGKGPCQCGSTNLGPYEHQG